MIYGENNQLIDCEITSLEDEGVRLSRSGNLIARCTIIGNETGIDISNDNVVKDCYIRSDENGIILDRAENSIIENCTIEAVENGIFSYYGGYSYVTITGNFIKGSEIGIHLNESGIFRI